MVHLVSEHKTAGAALHSNVARRVVYMDISNEMLSTKGSLSNGINIVKDLLLSVAEGQKTWTITQVNLYFLLSNLTQSEQDHWICG
ncbi:hypothetical protein [Thalassolituus pacificus]|uniref:Uncharacterized protein n=1 Tax=Thalassolituus pacificus TaxID=2975440 RepID=A0A9X3ARV3_9GAMM|nr:hypothetical protein [Thalassolituus pacificus]MCT7359239.1 hypothetical protein [Thalassolituus pacificus]